MEATLNEMVRRGWRPPTQGDALEEFTAYGSEAQPVDPDAYMPVRRYRSFAAAPEEEEFEDDEVYVPLDQPVPSPPVGSWETPVAAATPAPDVPLVNEATLPPAN
jgi:hypothetical protein